MKNNLRVQIVLIALLFMGSARVCFLHAQNVLDDVYVKENAPYRKPVPYTYLREADVMWKKRIWRVIDLREKKNEVLYYPIQPINNRKSLFDVIKQGLYSGQLTAYGNAAVDDEFNVPMTKSEIEGELISSSTQLTPDLNNPDVMDTIHVHDTISSPDIKQYRIKEVWFFDKQRSVLDVRVLGICPMALKKDENGTVQGLKALFWLYFPQARPLFAVSEVYNTQNDADRRTLEDVFWKRSFASYIYKESNVYNRYISDYKKGLNALLEAKKIKNTIFDYEQALWHY